MHHRHLLPQELDLLVDSDAGFGLAPLKAHVETCPECSAQLATLQGIAGQLDALPHFAPRHGFADRVMTQVQVIEPWHVALADSARRLIPETTGMRVLAAAAAGIAATTVSGTALWLAFRMDLLGWSAGAALEQGGRGAWGAIGATVRAAVGALGDGTTVAAGATALAGTAIFAVLAFRRLAAAARANRG
ncbi:MAG: hypothetical protein KF689_02500 [Gemmatimonadaceae bacterium]|nr:hypothetical protein [Gemmatimonadaceae bacterium]MCW5826807.1 hypothetical protein [Gemmatimonadaceae bacterium]